MANRKISQLPPVTAITNNDIFILVQDGVTVRGTASQIVGMVTGITGTDTFITGSTFNNNTITLTKNNGSSVSQLINNLSGLTVNGNTTITGTTNISGQTSFGGLMISGGTNLTNIFALAGSSSSSPFTAGTGTNSAVQIGSTNIASGTSSYAEGFNTTAFGDQSHAEGYYTTTINNSSHAEGYYTTAIGYAAHAEGWETTAIGEGSHSEGNSTISYGLASHAEGIGAKSLGITSHAEGSATIANWRGIEFETLSAGLISINSGEVDLTEEFESGEIYVQYCGTTVQHSVSSVSYSAPYTYIQLNDISAYFSSAIADINNLNSIYATTTLTNGSHAEGSSTRAIADFSHAEGMNTTAKGNVSHAEGWNTTAKGYVSHAEGMNTTANGSQSHAEGNSNVSQGNQSHAGGYNSIASGNTSFVHSNSSSVNGNNSSILGGFNNLVNYNVTGSTVLGGSNLIATNDDTVYGTNFNAGGTVFGGLISGTTYSGITHPFGFNTLFVDKANGSDIDGDGTEWNPYNTIRKALTGATSNATIFVRPGVYEEVRTHFNTEVSGNNITLFGMAGATIKGQDSTSINESLSFANKFVYHVNAAKTFNIVGFFNQTGGESLVSTETAGAVANIKLNTFNQSGNTTLNLRAKIGEINMVVENGNMTISDQSGIYAGPGDGNCNLHVINGDIVFDKLSTINLADLTRGFQLFNASTSRKSTLRANNFRFNYNSALNFTAAWDPIYLNSPNSTFEIYGNIIDGQTSQDGILTKSTGDDGCLIIYAGNLKLFGNISAVTTNAITTVGGDLYNVEVFGDVFSKNKYAILDNNSNASSKLIVHGKMSSNGAYPTIKKYSSSKLFIDGPVINSNSSPAAVGIDYTGSNLILTKNAGFDVQSAYPISTTTTGLSYKLMGDVLSTKDFPSLSAATSYRVTINTVRDSQVYRLTIRGVEYTFTSAPSSTNILIATGLYGAINAVAGITVVDNGNGTLDISNTTWTTPLTVSDTTLWKTNFKWEINNSYGSTSFGLTIDGTSSNYTTPSGLFYYSGGVTSIVSNVLTGVTASVLNSSTTTTATTYGFYIASTSNTVMSATSVTSDSQIYNITKPIGVSTLNYGYIGNLNNLISGTTVIYDTDVEFF